MDYDKIAKRVMLAMTFSINDYKSHIMRYLQGMFSEWMKKRISEKNEILTNKMLETDYEDWDKEVKSHQVKLEEALLHNLSSGNKEKITNSKLDDFFKNEAEWIANRSLREVKKKAKEANQKFKGIKWNDEDKNEFEQMIREFVKKTLSSEVPSASRRQKS